MKKLNLLLILSLFIALFSCSDDNDDNRPEILNKDGIFVLSNGKMGDGNGSLSFVDFEKKTITNDLFKTSNNRPLGDVAQYLTVIDNKGYVALNGSFKVEVFDIQTSRQLATITEFKKKPRCIVAVNNSKAYVGEATFTPSGGSISIVDLKTNKVTGTIDNDNKPVNDFVFSNGKVFAINYSKGNNTVQVIDPNTDKIIKTITVGADPENALKDANGNVWVLVTGGYHYPSWPCAYEENGKIVRINAATNEIDKTYTFADIHDHPGKLALGANGKEIYYSFNNSVYKMSIDATELPTTAILNLGSSSTLQNFAIHPTTGNIIVTDALDYKQRGKVYIYDNKGTKTKEYTAGIIPDKIRFTSEF